MPIKSATVKISKKPGTKVKKLPRTSTKPKTQKKKAVKKNILIPQKRAAQPIENIEAEIQPKPKQKKFGYKFSVGRRKSAVARVRFFKDGQGDIIINGKPIGEYFPYFQFQNIIKEPLKLTGKLTEGRYTIKVSGGGTRGQAESIRLGISRILLQIDKNSRPILKAQKLLTRDPRVVERKKYGLKKARRAPQWQKR